MNQRVKEQTKAVPKERVCATDGCCTIVTGRMVYCRPCLKKRHKQQTLDSWERCKNKPKPASHPQAPTSYQFVHDMTDDLQVMRELGLNSYGELSTWRRMQESRNAG